MSLPVILGDGPLCVDLDRQRGRYRRFLLVVPSRSAAAEDGKLTRRFFTRRGRARALECFHSAHKRVYENVHFGSRFRVPSELLAQPDVKTPARAPAGVDPLD